MTSDPPAEKRRIRREMRERLREITRERAQSAGLRIADELERLEVWRAAARVVLFASLPDEIDTSAIWLRAIRDGKPVLLPRLTSARSLEFAIASTSTLITGSRYSILEPPLESSPMDLNRLDLVLVPGLAFDRQGGRLGRGGGYYDRTFATGGMSGARPILIGVGFGFQVVDRLPMTSLDVRMDGILSEAEAVLVDGTEPEGR
ncbi:MAG: 5-formyltetrahydrofolate cyclo-ligase [Myxococcota bacterium]